jgi:hypothetical protein
VPQVLRCPRARPGILVEDASLVSRPRLVVRSERLIPFPCSPKSICDVFHRSRANRLLRSGVDLEQLSEGFDASKPSPPLTAVTTREKTILPLMSEQIREKCP